jgi:hypothetical protein
MHKNKYKETETYLYIICFHKNWFIQLKEKSFKRHITRIYQPKYKYMCPMDHCSYQYSSKELVIEHCLTCHRTPQAPMTMLTKDFLHAYLYYKESGFLK